MTYADLNRRTAYIFSYTLLLFLEQWIRKKIVEKYGRSDRTLAEDWVETLGAKRKTKLQRWSEEKQEGLLSVCDIKDLIKVLQQDPKLEGELRQVDKGILPLANKIRVKVAHPTKLLLPRDRGREQLKRLALFWERTIPFVEDNDFNEKNGGWPEDPRRPLS